MTKMVAMNMPELPVFLRSLVTGLIGAEIFRSAFYIGMSFAKTINGLAWWVAGVGIIAVVLLCTTYALKRGIFDAAKRIIRSFRYDLLLAVAIGCWANSMISPWLAPVHAAMKDSDPHWAPAILLLLCAVLASPLIQKLLTTAKGTAYQQFFIGDEEVSDEIDDLFDAEMQAKSFAEAVLESGAQQGLVFGVEGPWGVGKTSFINLAARHWENANDRVIVCRFEPLRYASEPDIADRMIRDVCTEIQRNVFAPEFRPAASRYSRLIKGKADISFLGFKLTLEPSQETADDLLEDIDNALRRIGRRVIIVIDDLDRLDAKTTNNVLFATRRTFKLSQATYVICYDTEVLAGAKEEGLRAREFLEKFVTVKLSLFIDSSKISEFLRRDWQREEHRLGSIPSSSMLKLSAVLNELASILETDGAASYLPLIGDMRKVKRFVNAMLLMQLEKSDLARTDFNKRDLIHLILLHLNFPGVFRRIYAEETEGRSGIFSLRRQFGEKSYANAIGFSDMVQKHDDSPRFLLMQLFDAASLGISGKSFVPDATLVSRACFNQDSFRNLESYLKLIVRFASPEPRATFVLYQTAVDMVRDGTPIQSVLASGDFKLELGEKAHDQFWNVLVNQAQSLSRAAADDAIKTLVDFLPRYSSTEDYDRGLRQRSIFSLLRLLDRAGWEHGRKNRSSNSSSNVMEIAWRIFGERHYEGKGLIQRLIDEGRGPLGWNDLMLFRLQCCADRGGQLHNLHAALILNQDKDAPTNGLTSELTSIGMRKLSQMVFGFFKKEYVSARRNFYLDVDSLQDEAFVGKAGDLGDSQSPQSSEQDVSISQRILAARTTIKSFVIYQLSNSMPPTGAGVGCGYYDESGVSDSGSISAMMNEYIFDVCFNPDIDEKNIHFFLSHCLSHLTNPFFSERDRDRYYATKADLLGGLDALAMGKYWSNYRGQIRQVFLDSDDRRVVTSNFIASYREDLPGIFDVLDELVVDADMV